MFNYFIHIQMQLIILSLIAYFPEVIKSMRRSQAIHYLEHKKWFLIENWSGENCLRQHLLVKTIYRIFAAYSIFFLKWKIDTEAGETRKMDNNFISILSHTHFFFRFKMESWPRFMSRTWITNVPHVMHIFLYKQINGATHIQFEWNGDCVQWLFTQ